MANMPEPMSFAVALRQRRLAAGLTQEALAERAGTSARGIQNLEGGVSRPYRDSARRLAAALGLREEEKAAFLAAGQPAPLRVLAAEGGKDFPRHNLPAQVTSFVGRERELAEIKATLGRSRLLTLIGTGGVGKTRLALQLAADLVGRYPDGVWLAELAPLADPALVPAAVAGVLRVREQAGQALLATLVAALRPRHLLLLLDSCEHLPDACASLADALLRGCPSVQLLATSRAALGMAGETSWRVSSLALPPAGRPLTPGELARSEAVRLFCESAAARPGFALTERNAAAVADLCRRLDGIPLALELAAARAGALGVRQLAEHLDDRFTLLAGGNRAALPRQQTLRAAVDWSYDLLGEPERRLFARLAVFVGGWTLAASQAICSGQGLARQQVPDLLARLVEQSLVQAEEQPDGDERYRLLETLRQYAGEKLEQSGEAAAIRGAHAAYFAAWAGGPGPPAPELPGERAAAGLPAAVAGELDNLRAALRHLLERGEAEAGLGLAARIYHLWFRRGPREEGREWLCRFLALPAAAAAPARGAALFAAGWLAQFQDDLAEADSAFGEAAVLARARGDRRGQALAQIHLGQVACQRVDMARARSGLEAGVRLARSALAPAVLLDGLAYLATLAVAQGDLAEARAALAEARAALASFPQMGFRLRWPAGDLALAEGDGERAAMEYRAALADRSAEGDPVGVATSVLGLAEVAAGAGDGARAARRLGGAEGIALGVAGGLILDPLYQRDQHARVEAAAPAPLGEGAFAARRAEGRRLGLDGVLRLALGEDADG